MKIVVGIASTTHIDTQGDKMAKSALISMAKQINSHFIPLTVEHKPIYIGVILCGKVMRLNDGEWALRIVSGIFEMPKEKQDYIYGQPNTVFRQYLPLIATNL
jgi:hypothetical protein